ncbi:MAG: hypothetical protein LUQ11_00555 [Methylococcaceae bacterium]|nr:hypothetical protein [Methylococcaceae bacterium]
MDAHLFHLLRQRVHKDHALQARLFELTDPTDFFAAIQALAEESGYTLEQADLLEATLAGRRAWHNKNR